MSNTNEFLSPSYNPLAWLTLFLLSGLAWIPTLQQTLNMLFLASPQFGTMGLPLWPFLLCWTVMMIAMMFPSLAPMISTRYTLSQPGEGNNPFRQMFVFLAGYLVAWSIAGIPIFYLAQLGEQCVLSAPPLGIAIGITLLVLSGLYQITPLKRYYLKRCNPALCRTPQQQPACTLFSQLRDGLRHGLTCLGCCGTLMLIMVAVGLMNLPWMLLLTLIIFLEKTWSQGVRLSIFVGLGLLIFAVMALIEPALLAGLYQAI